MLNSILILMAFQASNEQPVQPIALHPDNPHYFLFRGKPTILISSAEHYGAVLNLDFDYIPYLDELHARDFNFTRIFVGAYVEPAGAFNIKNNTLAPASGRFICPWARSSRRGYAGGGNKFDMERWDDTYFQRLNDFCHQASQRDIVVEVTLFCPYYEDKQWDLAPLKASNNVNGVGNVTRTEALTMKHPSLVAVQEAMARKVVLELRDFDNIYYEICNEPYFGGVTIDWQNHIADIIVDGEKDNLFKHLIAQNIANGTAKIDNPNTNISIFNFHYAKPEAVKLNYGLERVIGDDETGFKGTDDLPYRSEGWRFLLAGGGLYNNLDYSFTVGKEDGTFEFPSSQPGGGGPALRSQIKILKDFLYSFDFIKMAPGDSAARFECDTGLTPKEGVPSGATVQTMANPGMEYAIYIQGGSQADLALDIPAGEYLAEWVNPCTGAIDKTQEVAHKGGGLTLSSPPYSEDIALRLVLKK
ncbi:MAG: hypothetical protein H8D67_11905 [Deltaproteobacteria bacterium]|nr:hypothetical protein [Deltaproteobacteria bacterium]